MSAARVLEVGRSQLGTVENPPNSNRTKYGAAYGMDGNAWCAMFVWWVFQQAGVGGLIPKTAYTPTFAAWFKARGAWFTTPRPGDVVFFDFPGDGVNRISHVGLVEAINPDGSLICIEGNTSPGTSGSQRDGGGVYRRNRRAGIVGCGRPAYPVEVVAPRPRIVSTLRRGSTGEEVKTLQRALRISVDGDFGPKTEAAVKAFQRTQAPPADGIVGPKTLRALGL